MMKISLSLLYLFIFCSVNAQKAVDYLSVPGPLIFDNASFNLTWSSHPTATFYKQEYIVKGDVVERFKKMVLIDVVSANNDIKEVVGAKLTELKTMKATNPIVNYQVFDNAKIGEYMIDFILSQNAADGSIEILERNVYRYKTVRDKAGNKAILLFGVSTRAYGNEATTFLKNLKAIKTDLVNKVAAFKLPEITIKK